MIWHYSTSIIDSYVQLFKYCWHEECDQGSESGFAWVAWLWINLARVDVKVRVGLEQCLLTFWGSWHPLGL